MGMFDYLKCEYPLHDTEMQNAEFQTKDFDCQMENYTITKDGTIVHHLIHFETVPEEERPFWGKPGWDDNPLLQLAGSLRSVSDGDEVIPYHGNVYFYCIAGNDDFREYIAMFTNGKLQEITRLLDKEEA